MSRDSISNDHAIPVKGKYGLVTLADNENEKILVGPNFYAEARLSDKGIEADEDNENTENDETDMESTPDKKFDESKKKSDEKHKIKIPNYYPKDNEKQIEPVESEYEFVDQRLIPSNLDAYYNYIANPYLLPAHNYMPIPIINNQYLQRRAFNPYRYPYSYNQQLRPYPYYYVQ